MGKERLAILKAQTKSFWRFQRGWAATTLLRFCAGQCRAFSTQENLPATNSAGTPVDSDIVDLDNPDDFDGFIRLGEKKFEEDDYDEAISNFSAAIGISPEDPRGYRARGNVFARKMEYELAIADYTKAIEVASR